MGGMLLLRLPPARSTFVLETFREATGHISLGPAARKREPLARVEPAAASRKVGVLLLNAARFDIIRNYSTLFDIIRHDSTSDNT
jgi:hypothetical protein